MTHEVYFNKAISPCFLKKKKQDKKEKAESMKF